MPDTRSSLWALARRTGGTSFYEADKQYPDKDAAQKRARLLANYHPESPMYRLMRERFEIDDQKSRKALGYVPPYDPDVTARELQQMQKKSAEYRTRVIQPIVTKLRSENYVDALRDGSEQRVEEGYKAGYIDKKTRDNLVNEFSTRLRDLNKVRVLDSTGNYVPGEQLRIGRTLAESPQMAKAQRVDVRSQLQEELSAERSKQGRTVAPEMQAFNRTMGTVAGSVAGVLGYPITKTRQAFESGLRTLGVNVPEEETPDQYFARKEEEGVDPSAFKTGFYGTQAGVTQAVAKPAVIGGNIGSEKLAPILGQTPEEAKAAYDNLGINQWYSSLTGDPENLEYQIARMTALNLTEAVPSAGANLVGMQLVGNSLAKALLPAVKSSTALNFVRGGGMMLPSITQGVAAGFGNQTLSEYSDPIGSLNKYYLPEGEDDVEKYINSQEGMAGQRTATTLAMFGGGAPSFYKDAGKLFKISRDLGKLGIFGRVSKVNQASVEGRNMLNEYMQLQSSVIPDAAFGLTYVFDPVLRFAGSKWNPKVEAPTFEEWLTTGLLGAVAVRPHKSVQGFISNRLGESVDIAGQARFAAMDAMDRGSYHTSVVESRYEKLRGGTAANTQDLQRVTSYVYDVAIDEHRKQSQADAQAYKSVDQIFYEIMNGKSDQSIAVDQMVRQMRARGDNSSLPVDSPLRNLQVNRGLYPVDPKARKQAIKILAKQLEPTIAFEMEMQRKGYGLNDIEGPDATPERKYYAVYRGEVDGQPEYVVFNRFFSDATIHRGEAGLEDVQVISAVDQASLRNRGRTETLAKVMREMKQEFNAAAREWKKDGVSRNFAGIRTDGTIVIKEVRREGAAQAGKVTYSQVSLDDLQKELSGMPGKQGIINVLNEIYRRTGLRRDVATKRPVIDIGQSEAFPERIAFDSDTEINARMIDTIGIQTPIGVFQLPDGGVVLGGIPEGASRKNVLSETELSATPELKTKTVLSQAQDVVKNRGGYIDADIHELGSDARVEIPADMIGMIDEILQNEDMPDNVKAETIVGALVDTLAGNRITGDKAGRVDPQTKQFVFDVDLKVGDRVEFATDEASPYEISEGIVVKSGNGLATVKLINDPEGSAYTMSADKFLLSDKSISEQALQDRASAFADRGMSGFDRPVEKTMADEEAIGRLLTYTETVAYRDKIAGAKTEEDLLNAVRSAVFESRATVAGVKSGLLDWSLRNSVEGVFDVLSQLGTEATAPGKEVDIVKFRKLTEIVADEQFNEMLYGVHAINSSIASITGTRFATGDQKISTTQKKSQSLQLARRMNILMMRAVHLSDADLLKAASKSLGITLEGKMAERVMRLAGDLRGVAPMAFYYVQDMWHASRLSGLNFAAQATIGRAISAVNDSNIVSQVKNDTILSDVSDQLLNFWKSEAKYEDAVKAVRGLLNSPRRVTIEGQTETYAMRDVLYSRLRNAGLEFLFHAAVDETSNVIRRGLRTNRNEAARWQHDAMRYMYDSYLPQIVVDQINSKISSGDFMSDRNGRTEQTNNISFAPELLALHSQLIDSIRGNRSLTPEQRQEAEKKINDVVEELSGLSEVELNNLKNYDTDFPRDTRLNGDVVVGGKTVAKNQKANLRALSAEVQYDMSTAERAKEEGMSVSQIEATKHADLLAVFKNQAKTIFGYKNNLYAVKASFDNDPTVRDLTNRIDRLNAEKPTGYEEKRRELYRQKDARVSELINNEFGMLIGTLRAVKTLIGTKPYVESADEQLLDVSASAGMGVSVSDVTTRNTTLGDAIDEVLDDVTAFTRMLVSTGDATSTVSSDVAVGESTRATSPIDFESQESIDEREALVKQTLNDPKSTPEEKAIAQQLLADFKRGSNTFGTDLTITTAINNLEASFAKLGKQIDTLKPQDVPVDAMIGIYQVYTSLSRNNIRQTGAVANQLATTLAARNIMTVQQLRNQRIRDIATDAMSNVSMTDVVELQSGSLTPEMFAERNNINLSVAREIASIDALNPRIETEPVIVTDEDMAFIDPAQVDADVKAFVSDSPQIVKEAIESPDSFGGLITFKGDGEQKLVAYTAQNRAGMRVLLRAVLRKKYGTEQANAVVDSLMGRRSLVERGLSETYVDPAYMFDKLQAVGGKFDNLEVTNDVMRYLNVSRAVLKAKIEREVRDLEKSKTKGSEIKIFQYRNVLSALDSAPVVEMSLGQTAGDYFRTVAAHVDNALEDVGVSKADRTILAKGVLNDLSPDTNSKAIPSPLNDNVGRIPDITIERDLAFTARRMLASMVANGVRIRPINSTETIVFNNIEDIDATHNAVRLSMIPIDSSSVRPEVAKRMADIYTEMIETQFGLFKDNNVVKNLINVRDAYLKLADASDDTFVKRAENFESAEYEAIMSLADNLADIYDMNANQYARKVLDVRLRTNDQAYKQELAEPLRVMNVPEAVIQKLLSPETSASSFFNSDVSPAQKNYAMAYMTAKYKKEYYTKHNKIFITNQEMLEEVSAESKAFTTDKRDVYGFAQTLTSNRAEALGTLLFIGSPENGKYRTALTLVHEVFHPLFTGMDDATQIDFLKKLSVSNTLMTEAMDEVINLTKRNAQLGSFRDAVKASQEGIQKILDARPNAELALALQVKVANDGAKAGLTIAESLDALRGIKFNGEDLGEGWIAHGHEKFVTSMLNFITDYTIPMSKNAAASIDMSTLEVFQQMRGTLRHIMRRMRVRRPMDMIFDSEGTPHNAWYMRPPVQRYTFGRLQKGSAKLWDQANYETPTFRRTQDFAQLQKGSYLRLRVPNKSFTKSAITSPEVMLMTSLDSLAITTSTNPYGVSRFRFGFNHQGVINDQVGNTMLPFENGTVRYELLRNPSLAQSIKIFPDNGRDTEVVSSDTKPSREFMGEVVDMILRTNLTTFEQAENAGFKPVYFDGNFVWVSGETDSEGYFNPRTRANTLNPRVRNYITAGQHEYAYIVNADVRVQFPYTSESDRKREFKSKFQFIVGQDAVEPAGHDEYDPMVVGYSQFDPKFSALIYDTYRKVSDVVYQTVGNVRWKDQVALEARLMNANADSFTFRTQQDLNTALENYFNSTEFKAIKASRTSMQPLIIDGANRFESLLHDVISKMYATSIDGMPVITEPGEQLLQRLDDVINQQLSEYIVDQGLFRHNVDETLQTSSFTIEPGSRELEAVAKAMQTMTGNTMDIDILKEKLRNVYVTLNTRADIRVEPNTRITSAFAANGIPEVVTLSDGTEYHVRDVMHKLLRNERLTLRQKDIVDVETSFENFWRNSIVDPENGLFSGQLKAPYNLLSAKPTTAMYVLDTLLTNTYGNSVENKQRFLERLTSDLNPESFGDIENDTTARLRYREAVQAKNNAVGEYLAVAHALDAQSREMGRALYAWKDWSLLDGQESFLPGDGVVIRSPEGAMFRVNLNNPEQFVQSVSRQVGTGELTDTTPFSRIIALYNPDTRANLIAKPNSKMSMSKQDLNLSPFEADALNTDGTVDVIRPFGISNTHFDEEGNPVRPQLRMYRLTSTGKDMSGNATVSADIYQQIEAVELAHPYKSNFVTEDGNLVNNQRLLQQPINDLLRRAYLTNPDTDYKKKKAIANKMIVPREVHIAKLLIARALLEGKDTVPDSWRDKNAVTAAKARLLLDQDHEASVEDAKRNPQVFHNRSRTWMSEGMEANDEPIEQMSDEEFSYLRMPFELTPEQAKDPELRQRYNEVQSRIALDRALATSNPKNVIIKRETNPRALNVAVTQSDGNMFIAIPDKDYAYATRTLFSATGPVGSPTPAANIGNVPAGGILKIPFGNSPFTKRGGSLLMALYHESSSIFKSMILSSDFARPMLQNFRLANISNPKTFAAQFWGLSAVLPNLPSGPITGRPQGAGAKLANFVLGHRPELAFGEKQYHAKMANYLTKYGMRDNVIGYGIPGLHRRRLQRTYTWTDISDYGLKLTYNDWMNAYDAAVAVDPNVSPFDIPIQPTQAENIGEGALARRILPMVNAWERAGSLSTDIVRLKSFLEFAAFVDNHPTVTEEYQRDQMKRDYATFVNVATGSPSGQNLLMSDAQRAFSMHARTMFTSPNWFNSLMMQTYLPSMAKMYVAEGVNVIARKATEKLDPYGVGWDVIDVRPDQKWFNTMRTGEVRFQHAQTFMGALGSSYAMALAFQALGLYMARRQEHEVLSGEYIDFFDIKKINSPIVGANGERLDDKLGLVNTQWYNPFSPEFGVVRAANTLTYQMPQMMTLYQRMFMRPIMSAANEPSLSTPEAIQKYMHELFKANIEGRLGPLVQGAKMLTTGRTFNDEPAFQKHPGFRYYDMLMDRLDDTEAKLKAARESGNQAEIKFYENKYKKLSPVKRTPLYLLDKTYKLRSLFPDGASRFSVAMFGNLQIQSELKDLEEMYFQEHNLRNGQLRDGDPDLFAMQFPAFSRFFGVEGKFADYYLKDEMTKADTADMTTSQFNYLTRKYKWDYPNAKQMVDQFGFASLFGGIPGSGGYPDKEGVSLGPIGGDVFVGAPDPRVMELSKRNNEYIPQIIKRQPQEKVPVLSDPLVGRMVK